MAEYQKVEYRFNSDGTITETVIDGAGKACIQMTAVIEAALGDVENRELLPEYEDDGDALTAESVPQSVQNERS